MIMGYSKVLTTNNELTMIFIYMYMFSRARLSVYNPQWG